MANNEINNLIEILSSFPGLGPRSARRLVLKLLQKKKTILISFNSKFKERG